MALLHKGLSEAGGRKALAIIARENVLKRDEPSEPYDPLDYSFAVYGDPRGAPPWAWSVEGHHLSLHFTLVSETEMLSSSFLARQPLVATHRHQPAEGCDRRPGTRRRLSMADRRRREAVSLTTQHCCRTLRL